MWNIWKETVLSLFTHEIEPYYIGKTDMPVWEVEDALVGLGFTPDYFCFRDGDKTKKQITSMRLLYKVPLPNGHSIWRQMHIRLFDDGTVTGHDEIAYDRNAIDHLNGVSLRPIDDYNLRNISLALGLKNQPEVIDKILTNSGLVFSITIPRK